VVRGGGASCGGVTPPPRSPTHAPRPGRDVLRAPPVGGRGRRTGPRVPRGSRPTGADLPRVPPRPVAGAGAGREGARKGLHRGRAASRRPGEHAGERLLPTAADVPAHRRER